MAYSDIFLYCAIASFLIVPLCFLVSPKKAAMPAARRALMAARGALPRVLSRSPSSRRYSPAATSVPISCRPIPACRTVRSPRGRRAAFFCLPSPTWWSAFRDPVLTELEARVAAANLDVKTATIRLAESRFQRGVAASALLPSVNADAKYQYELYSQNGIAGLLTKLVPSSPRATPLTIPAISDWTVGFDASWELDLWGHVRRSVESADAQVDQSAEMRRDTLVSSLAELARDYVQLRGAQTQIAIANENLAIAREIQKVAEERQRKGVATGFDAQTSTAQAESVSARIPTLRSDESQYSNAIGFLLDEPPGALQSALGPRKRALAPPGVPSLGVPAELARRRPDIRAAEARLHAATADIGVAVAAFYPTIKLNGVVSLDALDAKNLFKASSLQYNAGPSVSLPIFDAGRLKSTLELRKAEQLEAAIAWHKTVLQAWREVVDALTAYRREAERRAGLRRQMEHSRQALEHRALALQDRRRRIFGCARRRAELSPGGAGLRRPARPMSRSISSRSTRRWAGDGKRLFPMGRWSRSLFCRFKTTSSQLTTNRNARSRAPQASPRRANRRRRRPRKRGIRHTDIRIRNTDGQ